MQYGICNLSIVPLRLESDDTSEMVSQVLYGDTFKILEQRKKWSRIRLAFDKYEGWIDNKKYLLLRISVLGFSFFLQQKYCFSQISLYFISKL